MQDAHDWTTDGSQHDDSFASVDPSSEYPMPTSFDPLVQDALEGAADIDALVDETLANLPADPGPASGPFTGLTGGVPGGAGTEELVGFINDGGSDITDLIDTVEGGGELTDEQIQTAHEIASRGINFDPLLTGDEMHNRTIDDIQRGIHGNVQTDSNGQTWKYSPESGSWSKIGESGGSIPTTDIPPFQRDR